MFRLTFYIPVEVPNHRHPYSEQTSPLEVFAPFVHPMEQYKFHH